MSGGGIIRGETGAQRSLGYELDVSGQDGCARCRMTVDGRHTNRHGVLHGGLVSVLLDSAMGATGSMTVDSSGRYPFLTISMSVNYLASAREGDALTATGRLTGGGRKVKFIEGELRDQDGRLIATASGVFKPVPESRLPAGTGAGG